MAQQDVQVGDTGTQMVNKLKNNADELYAHAGDTANPHAVTKSQVGLGNVPNVDATNADNITSGTISSSRLPPIAITTVQVAASEVAMLALTTQEGDVVVRTDENKSYVRNAGSAGDMTDFNELLTPTDAVLSVAGETGAISAGALRTALNVEDGAAADQSAAEVPFTPAGSISATDVQAAIEEVAAEAGGGSAVIVEDDGTPLTTDVTKLNFTGPGVTITEPVTDEITITIAGGGGTDDQTAAEVPFTPAGSVSATDVQAAIEEVDGDVTAHVGDTGNPHSVTKAQVGLSNVPNVDATNADNITSGTLSSSVLPPIAITTVQVAADEPTMLGLTTQEGDVVVRTDQNRSYVHNGGSAGTMADFTELATPTDAVLSVAGETGAISAGALRTAINVEDGAAADQSAAEVPFTPDGDIAATDVQAAVVEVRDEAAAALAAQTHTVADISDMTAVSRAVVQANTELGMRLAMDMVGNYNAFDYKPDGEPLLILLVSQSLGSPLTATTPGDLPNNPNVYDYCTLGVDNNPPNNERDLSSYAFRQLDPSGAYYDDVTFPYTGHPRGDTGGPALGMANRYQLETDRDAYVVQVHWPGAGIDDNWEPIYDIDAPGWNELIARWDEVVALMPGLSPVAGPLHPDVIWLSPAAGDDERNAGAWAERWLRMKAVMEMSQVGIAGPNTQWIVPEFPDYLHDVTFERNYMEWLNAVTGPDVLLVPTSQYPVVDGVHWDGNNQVNVGDDAATLHMAGAHLAVHSQSGGIVPKRPKAVLDNVYLQQKADNDSPDGTSTNLGWSVNTADTELSISHLYFDNEAFAATFGSILPFWEVKQSFGIRFYLVSDPTKFVTFLVNGEWEISGGSFPQSGGQQWPTTFLKVPVTGRTDSGGWTDVTNQQTRMEIMRLGIVGNSVELVPAKLTPFSIGGVNMVSEPFQFTAEKDTAFTDWMSSTYQVKDISEDFNIDKVSGDQVTGLRRHRKFKVTTTDSPAFNLVASTVPDGTYFAFEAMVRGRCVSSPGTKSIVKTTHGIVDLLLSGTNANNSVDVGINKINAPGASAVVGAITNIMFIQVTQDGASPEEWEWEIDFYSHPLAEGSVY